MVQASTPFLHAPPALALQEAPAAQGMQVAAALHTCPVPQVSPGFLVVPFMQPTGSQTVTPFLHASLFVAQVSPAVQSLQTPPMHSLLLPHGVPSRASSPSSQD